MNKTYTVEEIIRAYHRLYHDSSEHYFSGEPTDTLNDAIDLMIILGMSQDEAIETVTAVLRPEE